MGVLKVPNNKISLAVDLSSLAKSLESKGYGDVDHLTFLGSALFTRRVSGPRVVLCTLPIEPAIEDPETVADGIGSAPSQVMIAGKYRKTIDGTAFESYGAHANSYSCCYLTAACAIGASRKEMEDFLERFEQALQDYRNGAGRGDKPSAATAMGGGSAPHLYDTKQTPKSTK